MWHNFVTLQLINSTNANILKIAIRHLGVLLVAIVVRVVDL